jgi:cell division protein ZapA (FtsZ GTPase activity inhibitor)
MAEEVSLKVNIAGRSYPISVEQEEEAILNEAVAAVENNVKILQESYAVKDKQDLLAMTALQMSIKLLNNKEDEIQNKQMKERLNSVDSMLTSYLLD